MPRQKRAGKGKYVFRYFTKNNLTKVNNCHAKLQKQTEVDRSDKRSKLGKDRYHKTVRTNKVKNRKSERVTRDLALAIHKGGKLLLCGLF